MVIANTSNTLSPEKWGYDVRLGDRYLRFGVRRKLSELIVESAPLQADRVDTRSSPEEVSNEFGLLFARGDFSGGEGLRRAHQRNSPPLAESRYYDSYNLDFDEDGRASLLETSEQLDASASDPISMVYADGAIWYTDGTSVTRSTNPTSTTPSFANSDPHNGEGATNVTGIAALGTTVYAALNANGVHSIASGGAWTHHSDFAAENIWAVKGRIIGFGSDELREVRTAATSVLLLTLAPGEEITDVVDAGAFILAACTDGRVYSFTFDGTDVAYAAESPQIGLGEYPTAITSLLGSVYLTTIEDVGGGDLIGRFYSAALASDGVLDDLNVIKEWEAASAAPVGLHAARRGSVYLGTVEGADTHLWRYDVTRDALHRSHISDGVAGGVRSILRVEDRLWWTVDGEGIQRTTDTLAQDGYLIGPLANFFTEDEKSWAGVRTILDSVPVGAEARIAYATSNDALDDPQGIGWRPFAVVGSATEQRELTISGVDSRSLAIRVSLSRGTTDSPILRSYTVRAYPGSGDTLLSLPINCSDNVERLGRITKVPGLGDEVFNFLLGLQGQSLEMTLLREGVRFSGTVDRVSQPAPIKAKHGSRWMVSTVVFRGRARVNAPTSTNGFGAGLFGEGLFGQREGIV